MLAVLFNIFPDACRNFIIKLPHCHFRQPVIHCGIKVLKFVIRQEYLFFSIILSRVSLDVQRRSLKIHSCFVIGFYILRCPGNFILEEDFLSAGYE